MGVEKERRGWYHSIFYAFYVFLISQSDSQVGVKEKCLLTVTWREGRSEGGRKFYGEAWVIWKV